MLNLEYEMSRCGTRPLQAVLGLDGSIIIQHWCVKVGKGLVYPYWSVMDNGVGV